MYTQDNKDCHHRFLTASWPQPRGCLPSDYCKLHLRAVPYPAFPIHSILVLNPQLPRLLLPLLLTITAPTTTTAAAAKTTLENTNLHLNSDQHQHCHLVVCNNESSMPTTTTTNLLGTPSLHGYRADNADSPPLASFTCSSDSDQDPRLDGSSEFDSDDELGFSPQRPVSLVVIASSAPMIDVGNGVPVQLDSNYLGTINISDSSTAALNPTRYSRKQLPRLNSSSSLSVHSTTETIYYPRRLHANDTILPLPIASMISTVSMASRASIRLTSVVVDLAFESLKFGASATLGLGRRAMVSAASSARSLHAIAARQGTCSADHGPFFSVLDKYTNSSIYAIHNAFSLAELLTLSSFHLASSSINFSLKAAEECVQTFDGLFGETDTSKTLASFICIFLEELQGQDDELGLTTRFGKVYALGQLSKAMLAYCCLQYVTRKRWRSLIKLRPIYIGSTEKSNAYDPLNEAFSFNIFDATGPLSTTLAQESITFRRAATWPDEDVCTAKLHRRRSLDLRLTPSSVPHLPRPRRSNGASKYDLTTDLSSMIIPRRRCLSGPLMESNHASYRQDLISAGHHVLQKSGTALPSPLSSITTSSKTLHSDLSTSFYGVGSFLNLPTTMTSPLPLPKLSGDEEDSFHDPPPHTPTVSIHHALEPVFTDAARIELASRYIKFATGAYGSNFLKIMGLGTSRDHMYEADGDHHNHQSLAFHANIPVEHIIASSFLSPTTLEAPSLIAPVHYVVVDHETKAVIVSLRGTLGISDIVTDLTASYLHYTSPQGLDGYVHSGMFKSAQQISRSSTPNGRDKFVTNEDMGFPVRTIDCYVFGSPAIMSAELSRSYKLLIHCFIFRNDVMPCLSLGLVRDFRNVTVNLCQEHGMAERIIGQILGVFKKSDTALSSGVDDSDESLWYWSLLKTLRADMKAEKLYPPGKIYWINANTGTLMPHSSPAYAQTTAFKSGTSAQPTTAALTLPSSVPINKSVPISVHEVQDVELAFSELAFSTRMFTDHSPHHYEGSLELLVRAMTGSKSLHTE
ncbi:hypothetical protein BASA60_008588 [Batrachochytrium salamandrivorans]|nr:hypothetical protein BASA60_008588 [Batrachochytrium salamandrivorans]